MTSYSESDFRKVVSAELRGLGAHVVAIESRTFAGIPDINWCYQGVEGWIELKMVRGHKLRHPLTAQQRNWIRQRKAAGGRVHILTREFPGKGQGYIDKVSLYDGHAVDIINDVDAANPGDHALLILQKPFNWQTLLTALIN